MRLPLLLGLVIAASLGSTTAFAEPLEVRMWTPDAPVPAGWHPERRVHLEAFGVGLGVFAAAYIPSLFVATIGSSDPVKVCDPSCRNPYWPFFIPVIGPLAALSTIGPLPPRASDWIVGILALDTIAQAAGLVLAGFGLVPRLSLVPNGASITVAPTTVGTGSGLVVRGTF